MIELSVHRLAKGVSPPNLLGLWFLIVRPPNLLGLWFLTVRPPNLLWLWFLIVSPPNLLWLWFLIVRLPNLLGLWFLIVRPPNLLGLWFLIVRPPNLLWLWFLIVCPWNLLLWLSFSILYTTILRLKQTHCTLVACDSEWVTVVFYSTFLNIHQSGVLTALFWLVRGWCHV